MGPLWKIHGVVVERTGQLCQTDTVNTQLQNLNGLGFSKALLTPNSPFMKENVYDPKSGISKGLTTGKSFFTISSKLVSKVLCLKIRAFTEKNNLALFSSSAEQEPNSSLKTSEVQDQPCVKPWVAEASQRPPCHTCISIHVFNQALDR